MAVLPHGPYDHYQAEGAPMPPLREAPADVCNILFFGIIRPYKGLEDLVEAFDRLAPDRGRRLLADGRGRDLGGLHAARAR